MEIEKMNIVKDAGHVFIPLFLTYNEGKYVRDRDGIS
ncbi:hypothetical protein XBFFL1_2160001 [Xenorhabdus bovienii str. feltiae Florida]|nr:hypothetical protein XBFFL1_2160001 [Xenorhabdus bovienii str. feltiae Florida]